jgi:mycothiol synthase
VTDIRSRPTETIVAIEGFEFRPFRHDSDFQTIADLIEVSHLADGDEYLPDAHGVREELVRHPGFDPARDILLAEADGRVIGYGAAQRQDRGEVIAYVNVGTVHPEYRRRGLGRAILRRTEARLREVGASDDAARRREFRAFIGDRERGARELLESEGYRQMRWFYTMKRVDLDALPSAPVPDGLELRPLEAAHHRAVHEASNEAFRDHWDHRETTEADFVSFFAQPDLEPGLSRIAWAGDEVAGSVLTCVWKNENRKLGVNRAWFERVSVRRPWRGRGLARAMIVSALGAVRDAGLDAALLGVDADNPSGALRLYEGLGFTVDDSGTAFRKDWTD